MNNEMNVFLNSIDFMASTAHKDKESYEAYKKNHELIGDASVEELEIIAILEKLGYPTGEVGTYLYKALIVCVLDYLRGFPVRREVLSEEELKEQLDNPFSQLFFDIARNDMDLGIKTFHAAITRASANIDVASVDRDIINQIFAGNYEPINYSSNALNIAKYYFELGSFKKSDKKLNRIAKVKNNVVSINMANRD